MPTDDDRRYMQFVRAQKFNVSKTTTSNLILMTVGEFSEIKYEPDPHIKETCIDCSAALSLCSHKKSLAK